MLSVIETWKLSVPAGKLTSREEPRMLSSWLKEIEFKLKPCCTCRNVYEV